MAEVNKNENLEIVPPNETIQTPLVSRTMQDFPMNESVRCSSDDTNRDVDKFDIKDRDNTLNETSFKNLGENTGAAGVRSETEDNSPRQTKNPRRKKFQRQDTPINQSG